MNKTNFTYFWNQRCTLQTAIRNQTFILKSTTGRWAPVYYYSKFNMAAATTPAVPEQSKHPLPGAMPFDISQPPNIEGFSPTPKLRDESFKDKFIRKTKENPFVPIGELYKPEAPAAAQDGCYTSEERCHL